MSHAFAQCAADDRHSLHTVQQQISGSKINFKKQCHYFNILRCIAEREYPQPSGFPFIPSGRLVSVLIRPQTVSLLHTVREVYVPAVIKKPSTKAQEWVARMHLSFRGHAGNSGAGTL